MSNIETGDLAAVALGHLASCNSSRLSAGECGTLIDQAVDFAALIMPPDAEDWFGKSHADEWAELVARVLRAGPITNTYNGMSRANDPSALRQCVMDEGRRNK